MQVKEKIANLTIVFFCSEIVGYMVGMLNAIIKLNDSVRITVVYKDKNRKSGFQLDTSDKISYLPRSAHNVSSLYDLLLQQKPDILYLPGWMDDAYLAVGRKYKKKYPGVQVVAGIDDQWRGSVRQYIGIVYFWLFYRSLFDYLWVSGKPQYHFAQRMGYDHHQIISNLYSADTTVFYEKSDFTKRFVFVGRFDPVKGIFDLMEAYERLPEHKKKEWPLVIIGDGPLKEEIIRRKSEYIILIPYLQPAELTKELKKGGVYCLTGYFEQWSVATHEMAILGFPLLLSSICGAATEFLINGYNGQLYVREEKDGLYNALNFFTTLDDKELHLFSDRSHQLGKRINPEITAASLLSVVK